MSGVQYPADVRDPGVRVGAPQQNVPDGDALPRDHEGEGVGATVQIGFRFVCDGLSGGAGCVPRVVQQIAGHVRLGVDPMQPRGVAGGMSASPEPFGDERQGQPRIVGHVLKLT